MVFSGFETFFKIHVQYDSLTSRDAALITIKSALVFSSSTWPEAVMFVCPYGTLQTLNGGDGKWSCFIINREGVILKTQRKGFNEASDSSPPELFVVLLDACASKVGEIFNGNRTENLTPEPLTIHSPYKCLNVAVLDLSSYITNFTVLPYIISRQLELRPGPSTFWQGLLFSSMTSSFIRGV